MNKRINESRFCRLRTKLQGCEGPHCNVFCEGLHCIVFYSCVCVKYINKTYTEQCFSYHQVPTCPSVHFHFPSVTVVTSASCLVASSSCHHGGLFKAPLKPFVRPGNIVSRHWRGTPDWAAIMPRSASPSDNRRQKCKNQKKCKT